MIKLGMLNNYTSDGKKPFIDYLWSEKTVSRLVVYRTGNYGNIALSGGNGSE